MYSMEIPEKIKTSKDAPVDKNSAAKINVFVFMLHFPPIGFIQERNYRMG
ncbi:MAG: hypothetical protein ACQEXQ_28370 [Bacillota bacterium]